MFLLICWLGNWTAKKHSCSNTDEGGNQCREPTLGHKHDEAHDGHEQAFAIEIARFDAMQIGIDSEN